MSQVKSLFSKLNNEALKLFTGQEAQKPVEQKISRLSSVKESLKTVAQGVQQFAAPTLFASGATIVGVTTRLGFIATPLGAGIAAGAAVLALITLAISVVRRSKSSTTKDAQPKVGFIQRATQQVKDAIAAAKRRPFKTSLLAGAVLATALLAGYAVRMRRGTPNNPTPKPVAKKNPINTILGKISSSVTPAAQPAAEKATPAPATQPVVSKQPQQAKTNPELGAERGLYNHLRLYNHLQRAQQHIVGLNKQSESTPALPRDKTLDDILSSFTRADRGTPTDPIDDIVSSLPAAKTKPTVDSLPQQPQTEDLKRVAAQGQHSHSHFQKALSIIAGLVSPDNQNVDNGNDPIGSYSGELDATQVPPAGNTLVGRIRAAFNDEHNDPTGSSFKTPTSSTQGGERKRAAYRGHPTKPPARPSDHENDPIGSHGGEFDATQVPATEKPAGNGNWRRIVDPDDLGTDNGSD